jgi:hypothetical protein
VKQILNLGTANKRDWPTTVTANFQRISSSLRRSALRNMAKIPDSRIERQKLVIWPALRTLASALLLATIHDISQRETFEIWSSQVDTNLRAVKTSPRLAVHPKKFTCV